MIPSKPELDELIHALREDLPSSEDEARLRQRLAGAGVLLGAACVTQHVSSHLGLKAGALASKWGAHYGKCVAWLEGLPAAGSSLLGGMSAATKGAAIVTAVGVGAAVGSAAHFASKQRVDPMEERADAPAVTAHAPASTPSSELSASAPPAPEDQPVYQPTPPPPRVGIDGTHGEPVTVSAAGRAAAAEPVAPRATARAAGQPAGPEAEPVQNLAPRTRAAVPATAPGRESAPASPASAASVTSARTSPAGSASERRRVYLDQTLPGSPTPDTLTQETQLLERALLALRNRDVNSARRWLREHRRRFPRGVLAPERQSLLVRVEDEAGD